ncbi:hypothetical protein KW803_00960 [Candidatus Saccharibacteria bacterium]|nr:hypothetical protein [Candidatus Saccharibacteria bacterium]
MKRTRQSGFAHLALVLLVLVMAVVAFAGYMVYQNRQDTTTANTTSTALTGDTSVKVINSASDLDDATNTLNGAAVDSDLNPDQLNSDISNLL